MIQIIYRLTCFCGRIIWQLYANVSPSQYHETRLTSLYIGISINPRLAPNGSGHVLGSVSLTDVPFSQNVTTQYSGGLFGAGRNLSVDADDAWGDDNVHTW